MDLHYKSISEIGSMLRSGAATSVALTEIMLERIDRLNGRLNAFNMVLPELSKDQARQADEELRRGCDRGALHGIPVAVKDLFATRGVRTTSGSKLFADRIPEDDARAVGLLRKSGSVLLGKTAMYELAAGTTGINPFFGTTENPWKSGYDPGGSSSGSASAVAAGLAFAALGTDTGCSIRHPAHCCGVVGYKPTFGLVSKAGVQPLVRTMDHVGPLTRNVQDAETVFDALVGRDRNDFYSVEMPRTGEVPPNPVSLKDAKLGIVRRYFFDCEPEIERIINQALAAMENAGAVLLELDIPDLEDAFSAIETVFVEAASIYRSDLKRYPDKFSEEVRDSMEARLATPATDYVAAQDFRQGFRSRMERLFSEVDVLVAPTSRRVSAPLSVLPDDYAGQVWKNTSIFNFTGHPSISVPCGFTTSGLPVGLMMSGKLFADRQLLRLARSFEKLAHWHKLHPDV